MTAHTKVRTHLYEYLRNELPEAQKQFIAKHLEGCLACRTSLERLSATLQIVPQRESRPSDGRTVEFWNGFATRVEQGISRQHEPAQSRLLSLWDSIHSFLFFHRGSFALASGAVAIVLLAIILIRKPDASTEQMSRVDTAAQDSPDYAMEGRDTIADRGDALQPAKSISPAHQARVEYADDRVSQYLRKSKVLLIGIANLKTNEGQPIDLSTERRTSRALVQEARYLKSRPLSPRTEELIDELNRILIELANVAERNEAPNIELIRGGIHQENILFKIRMAETALDTNAYSSKQSTF